MHHCHQVKLFEWKGLGSAAVLTAVLMLHIQQSSWICSWHILGFKMHSWDCKHYFCTNVQVRPIWGNASVVWCPWKSKLITCIEQVIQTCGWYDWPWLWSQIGQSQTSKCDVPQKKKTVISKASRYYMICTTSTSWSLMWPHCRIQDVTNGSCLWIDQDACLIGFSTRIWWYVRKLCEMSKFRQWELLGKWVWAFQLSQN